jgi:hypothetical protein
MAQLNIINSESTTYHSSDLLADFFVRNQTVDAGFACPYITPYLKNKNKNK